MDRRPAARFRMLRRGIAALAVIAVLAAVAWAGVVSSGWMAHSIRQAIVARLGQSLGRAVALGGVGGNLLDGIDLRDLVIAERGGFSRGAAFSVDRVHLTLSLWEMVRHPRDVLASITRADLTTPHLELVRDVRGRWNLADLLEEPQSPLGPAFHGQIVVHGGIIAYVDSWGVESPPFVTRFERIDGTLTSGPDTRLVIALAGRSTDGEQAAVHGRYAAVDGTYDFDITADRGSVRHWGGYLVRLGALRWTGGQFSGRVHLLATSSRAGVDMAYTATIRLDDAEALYRPAAMPLRHVRGEMRVTTGHVSADGLTLVAGDSPVWVRGEVAYAGDPWLDLVVRSQGLDLARARALFFPGTGMTLAGRATGDMWISGPVSAPAFSGTVAAADGRFNRQDFSGLTMRFTYNDGVLSLRDLSAGVGGGHVAGDAVIDLAAPEPSYTFAASAGNVDAATLLRAGLPVADGLTARGSGAVAGAGQGSRMRVLGNISLGRGSLRGQTFDNLTALFWDDNGSLLLDNLRVQAGSATVYASGSVATDGTLALAAEGHDLPLGTVAARTGLAPSALSGTGRFDGHIGGSAASPVLSGDVAAWDGRFGPLPYTYAAGTIDVTSGLLSTRRADLYNGSAYYGVSGALALRPLPIARDVAIDAEGVPAQSFLHDTVGIDTVTGTLSGRVRVNGPVDRPSVAGHVALTRGSVLGQVVDQADADLAGGGGVIQLTRLDARANGSYVHASGTVDPRGPLDLNFQADRIRLADVSLLTRFGVVPYGAVTVDGHVTGTLADPEFQGRLVSPDLWMKGQAFSASGIVDYRSGQVRLSPLDLVQGDASYSLTGSVSWVGEPAADLNLHVTHGHIATLVDAAGLRLPAKVEGVIDGDVALAGPLRDPSAQLTLALSGAKIGGVPAGTGAADLVLSHGAIDIRQFELHPGRGSLAARGQVSLNGISAVELSATNLDPAIFVPIFHLQQPLIGSVDFTMQWTGPAANPTAGLSLEASDAGVPGATVDRVAALAYYKNGTITIQDGMLAKGAHRLVVEGTLPVAPDRFALDPQGALRLTLHLEDADLSLLTLLTPAIQDASGTVAGQVSVGGTVAHPTMTGSVQTTGGRMRWTPMRTPIENVAASITFSHDLVQVQDVSADIGGGHLAIQGTAAVSNFRPQTLDFGLTAKQLNVDVPGLYSGRVDANLALRGPAGGPLLSGGITMSGGRVTYAGTLPGGRAAVARAPVPPVNLDVAVATGADVSYGEGPVQLALAGSVHAGGTLAQPKLSGEVRSDGGTVNLFGTSFTVLEGRATFSEGLGLTPLVTARAQGQIGDTRVFVDVAGPLSNPSVVWSSEPPMSQSDILALVFGATGEGGTTTGLAGRELGRLLIGSVTSAIQRALHLDELSVSYDTQSPVTLRIGKFLTAKFYVTLTEVFAQATSPGATPAVLPGPFTRPTLAGQSYTVLGLEYLVSPSVSLSYDADTLGDNGFFLLTRFPF
ncbi:MAG TPA: translocation/assembly module TamB domain-containing protein [bacterium]|nr:translocation/assembly module TamB domain-containing protein [bacterium]